MLKCYYADIALLDNQSVFEKHFFQLDEERRKKTAQLKNTEDKKRSVMAGSLLRIALFREGADYDEGKFLRTTNGKPYLAKEIILPYANAYLRQYSVSHSKRYASVILSDREVGIDVEFSGRFFLETEREKRLESMAKKCFAPAEWERFSQANLDEKTRLFLEYWTRKESYSKAIGLGMKMNFSAIDTETDKEKYFSTWTEDDYCISIYVEDENYNDLEIEKIERL